jgi:hypothetical protein
MTDMIQSGYSDEALLLILEPTESLDPSKDKTVKKVSWKGYSARTSPDATITQAVPASVVSVYRDYLHALPKTGTSKQSLSVLEPSKLGFLMEGRRQQRKAATAALGIIGIVIEISTNPYPKTNIAFSL